MMNEIDARYIKRQAHLKILTSATKALLVTERAYTHLDGRIREVEDEIDWLRGICEWKGFLPSPDRTETGD